MKKLINNSQIKNSTDFEAWFDSMCDFENDSSLDASKYPIIRNNLKEKLSKEYIFLVYKKKLTEELDSKTNAEIMKINEREFVHLLIPEFDSLNTILQDRLLDDFTDYLNQVIRRIKAEEQERLRREKKQKLEEQKRKENEERKHRIEEKKKHDERVKEKLKNADRKIRGSIQKKIIDRGVFFEGDYPDIIDIILKDDEYKTDEELYEGYIEIIEERREWLRNIEWEKEFAGGLSQNDANTNILKIRMHPMVPYYINEQRYYICNICHRLITERFISEVDSECPTRGKCIQCKNEQL